MKILLIVPDGVAVRNYLYSSFVEKIINSGGEVILYHQILDSAILEIEKLNYNFCGIKRIPRFVENPKARILRESLAYARLLRNKKKLKNKTIMAFWNGNHKSLKKKILYKLAEILGVIISKSYKIILKFDRIYEKEIYKSSIIAEIEADFKTFQPDIVLNLHQRSPVSAPIIEVAKINKIKTCTVIFSWDNVPKARLISRYDSYFVWSLIMKNELNTLYPEIAEKDIKIVGTPQFEFYFNDKYQLPKKDFFKTHGLDIMKKTICFSANDMSSPYEYIYLEDVCEEISRISEDIRPQILFRRCPVDKSNRFDNVLEKYKSFVFAIDPDWRFENGSDKSFSGIYPSYNDIYLLVNTVKHCDLVINLGSTMAHDFAVYNKPCLYLNYDPVADSKFKVEICYNFEHFRTMKELDAVGWINNKSEIITKINEAINSPNSIGKEKMIWMQRIVNHPLKDNSQNIVNKLISCT